MKFLIDTNKKTIKFSGDYSFEIISMELTNIMGEAWGEYKLELGYGPDLKTIEALKLTPDQLKYFNS